MWVKAILAILMSYLIGSIPFGLIVGKVGYRIDIRKEGSGNIGAANIFRILGTLPSGLVLVGDTFKGVFAVAFSQYLFSPDPFSIPEIFILLAGLAVIIGHDFSFYLKFSGGKGIATTFGVLLAINFKLALLLLLVWLLILATKRYVSLASITAAATFPLLTVLFYKMSPSYILFSLAVGTLVIYKHKENIKRLLAGKETKIAKGSLKRDC